MDEPFVIRPLRQDDLEWLSDLAKKLGAGFTSLPDNKEYITKRVATVVNSFAETIPPPARVYLFVRENLDTGERVGISGIQACVGFETIFYNFEISTVTEMHRQMHIKFDHIVLDLVNNFQDATELISFWIDPESRHKHYGKSLSFARLLYMAQFPQLFGTEVISEIIGISDEAGKSPFWEAIGRHFFGMDFATADYLTMSTDKQIIADLMPHMPIYVDLLPPEAQQVLGRPHPNAEPAKALLESQGFKYHNYVDIFDGGPLLTAEMRDIKLLADSRVQVVTKIVGKLASGTKVLIGNTMHAMRITVANISENSDGVTLTQETAKILQIMEGAQVRYAKI